MEFIIPFYKKSPHGFQCTCLVHSTWADRNRCQKTIRGDDLPLIRRQLKTWALQAFESSFSKDSHEKTWRQVCCSMLDSDFAADVDLHQLLLQSQLQFFAKECVFHQKLEKF